MGKGTPIQWSDDTANPAMGCSGCELWNEITKTCYAGQLHIMRRNHPGFAKKFEIPELFPGRMVKAAQWADLKGKPRPDKPWLDGRPRLIFVSDMGDALSEGEVLDAEKRSLPDGVPFDYLRAEIIDVVVSPAGLRHRWLWLTKRPKRMAQFSEWLKKEHGIDWPLNLWAGTSITTNGTLPRVEDLLRVGGPGTIRFVSVEPLWEEVSLTPYLAKPGGLAWVLCGGESKQGDDPHEFKLEWARLLRDECAASGVPFFLKQVGNFATESGVPLDLKDGHGGDWNEWAPDLRVRQVPLAPAGAPVAGPPETTTAPKNGDVWSAERVREWSDNATAQARSAIRHLLAEPDGLSTHELNKRAAAASGGAIVGGVMAWATRQGLPSPLVRSRRAGQMVYRFASAEIRELFAEVLEL